MKTLKDLIELQRDSSSSIEYPNDRSCIQWAVIAGFGRYAQITIDRWDWREPREATDRSAQLGALAEILEVLLTAMIMDGGQPIGSFRHGDHDPIDYYEEGWNFDERDRPEIPEIIEWVRCWATKKGGTIYSLECAVCALVVLARSASQGFNRIEFEAAYIERMTGQPF